MKNIAVILASGQGSRFGGETPKQFAIVAGKTILEHTLDIFERHPLIDAIAVVTLPERAHDVSVMTIGRGYKKVSHVIAGGSERWQSSEKAVRLFSGSDCNLLIHDAVRPLVSPQTITACVEALRSYKAVETAVPATDTIIELAEDGSIARIPQRKTLMNAQTPQCFRASILAEALQKAAADTNFAPTDDCSIVHEYMPEVAIKVVQGEPENIKITYKEDIGMMERIIKERSGQR